MSAKHASGIATEASKSQDWTLGTGTSSRSFEIESWSYVQHKDYQLHILQKAEKISLNRPIMPTTESQRLTYYRGYVTSVFKTQVTYMQQLDFSSFFWIYILNLIFRTIPMNYLHVFLAAYSPDEHLYASKMSPFLIGMSWQVVMCGVIQLVASADILVVFLHYGIMGFIKSSPWFWCSTQLIDKDSGTYCLTINDLINSTQGFEFGIPDSIGRMVTADSSQEHYIFMDSHGKNTSYMGSPQAFFKGIFDISTSILAKSAWIWMPYYLFIWIGAALCYKQLFRTHIWKMLSRFQGALSIIYCGSLVIIAWAYLDSGKFTGIELDRPAAHTVASEIDFDMLSESVTGPPVIQILSSRSKDPVNPGRDSFMISASNTLFYFFKSMVNYYAEYYVETKLKIPVIYDSLSIYPFFYNWPFFFYYILLIGDIASRVFYLLSSIVESLLFVVTYQLLVETVVCEWHWTRRWVATVVISIAGIIINVFITFPIKLSLYYYTTRLAALCEAVVIFWLYPLGRLSDDIYFHNGQPAPRILHLCFMIVPFYQLYKLMRCIRGVSRLPAKADLYFPMKWMWIPALVPIGLGMFYALLKYLIKDKQNWRVLFRPRPDWGPREHVTRQLRKQFDSRDYIGSQASRYLSRHLLYKAQTPTYRLDIRYETAAERRSTVIADSFKFEDRKIH